MKKYANGQYIELTQEEEAEILWQGMTGFDPEPTAEERIAALEEQNAMLLEALLEISEEVYN